LTFRTFVKISTDLRHPIGVASCVTHVKYNAPNGWSL